MYEEEILEIYKKSDTKSFPIDCDQIIKSIGFSVHPYSVLVSTDEDYRFLQRYTGDAFTDAQRKRIYYNDRADRRRIRFSKMHETGHIVLCTDNENYADLFASNILAPLPVIELHQFQTADEISLKFDISISAANRVLMRGEFGISDTGEEMINYFYPPAPRPKPILAYKEPVPMEIKKRPISNIPVSKKRRMIQKKLKEYEESARFLMEIDCEFFQKLLPYYHDSRFE